MIKNKSILEIKKNDRVYQLSCEQTSPLGELYDILCEMKGFVFTRIQEAEKPSEPEVVEVKAE